ncbi:hypothetical protein T08_9342 [Trichinella sp. T8]|nr:hypothetical protein T08_9342 [Trichinella sp. T8]
MDFHYLPNHLSQRRALLQRTSERTCRNVYIHSDFSIDIDLVDVIVGLMGECEAWQKIISVTLVAYPTYVSRCLTLRAQCLSFMQIRPLEY